MRKENGITLIALVITIIVLLILAGVTIAMLTGENGLLSRASSTGPESAIAAAKEEVMLIWNDEMADYYKAKYVNGTSNASPISGFAAAVNEMSTDKKHGCTVSANTTTGEVTITHTGHTGNITGTVTSTNDNYSFSF